MRHTLKCDRIALLRDKTGRFRAIFLLKRTILSLGGNISEQGCHYPTRESMKMLYAEGAETMRTL